MDYKEYTRLRDIAQKRIKRAQAAGVPLNVHVPTVKELKQQGEYAQHIAYMQLEEFVSSGFSLERRRESERPNFTAEEKRKRRREYSRDYRRRRVAKEFGLQGKRYEAYLKGLKTLGVDIPPSKLASFFKYMDYRFGQGGRGEKKYVFDIFVEDYIELLQKGYNPNQILSDFRQFEADQLELERRAGDMSGMSYEKAIGLWDAFINR